MEDLKSILALMFDDSDSVCPSNSKWAYHSMPIGSILSGSVCLVSPNEKVYNQVIKSEELTLLAINPINGFRSDSNVTAYRNFLFELDVGTLTSQMRYSKNIGLPYSAAIFSGNKSIHFLVCLDQDLDEKTYRLLYEWALKIGTLFDQACKNPSRSVRIPGAIRPETGKKQQLIENNGKTKLEDFLTWLSKYEHLRPKAKKKRKSLTSEPDFDMLSPWLKTQLKEGLDFTGGRNQKWFAIFCDFALAGYPEEEAIQILEQHFQEEHDFKEKEWLITAASAYKKMANKGD